MSRTYMTTHTISLLDGHNLIQLKLKLYGKKELHLDYVQKPLRECEEYFNKKKTNILWLGRRYDIKSVEKSEVHTFERERMNMYIIIIDATIK